MQKYLFAVIILCTVTAGCVPSRTTSSWKMPALDGSKFNRILVVALVRDDDTTLSGNMENQFVHALGSIGYTALSSSHELGKDRFIYMDEQHIFQALKGYGVDAVLTINLLDKEEEVNFIPAPFAYKTDGFYTYGIDGFQFDMYSRLHNPGSFVLQSNYYWESILFDMALQKVVYTVKTQTFSQDHSLITAHTYSRLVINQMTRQKVLSKKPVLHPKPF